MIFYSNLTVKSLLFKLRPPRCTFFVQNIILLCCDQFEHITMDQKSFRQTVLVVIMPIRTRQINLLLFALLLAGIVHFRSFNMIEVSQHATMENELDVADKSVNLSRKQYSFSKNSYQNSKNMGRVHAPSVGSVAFVENGNMDPDPMLLKSQRQIDFPGKNETGKLDSKTMKQKGAVPSSPHTPSVMTRTSVAMALSTNLVGFALLTKGDQQFVAFCSATRALTVAQRTVGNATWRFKELSSKIGWDHNDSIVLGLDETNCLHVLGSIGASPLVYFRASKPLDIDSLVHEPRMVGDGPHMSNTTHHLFINAPDGELVYFYHQEVSIVMIIYNAAARTWRQLHGSDGLLITGMAVTDTKNRSPYSRLRRGPDGRYHLIWLWRDQADASTGHHLCYTRSPDLRHWETAEGRPLATPISSRDTEQVSPFAHTGVWRLKWRSSKRLNFFHQS